MHNKRLITGFTVLLALMMSVPTFAKGENQSVIIGEAPGGRVTSSVEKTAPENAELVAPGEAEDLNTHRVVIKSTTAAETVRATTAATSKVVTTAAQTMAEGTKATAAQTTSESTKATAAQTTAESTKATAAQTTSESTKATAAQTTSESTKATAAQTAAEGTKAAAAQTTAEGTKAAAVQTTTESTKAANVAESGAVVKANANFKPARSAIVSSANEAGPGVKATTAAETEPEESETDKLRKEIVAFALKHVGVRYRWGGANLAKGVDCSGLTSEVYKKFGMRIGRTSRDQANRGRTIPIDQIKPGDLLIYKDHTGYINHVTMYIGDGKLINASSENTGVIISDIGYRTPLKAVRFIQD